jgi:drug/metabolite transporter (DMT)-like permease
MSDNIKIFLIACILILSGVWAAHNAKWMRDGISPWWTTYIVSVFNATIYAYMNRSGYFSLTYTSVFQVFFFHAAWYTTTIFWIGEELANHRLLGLFFVFGGMILMSIK